MRRQDQARQGHEVDGTGRRRGCSSWSTARVCLASGGEARGANAGAAQSTAPRSRTAKEQARVIADKAYDSNALRTRLGRRGIELIAPHRRNRRTRCQDGRPLRRYRRRWKVERTFAWLGNFRRLVVRYERLVSTYSAFFHLACMVITLRRLSVAP